MIHLEEKVQVVKDNAFKLANLSSTERDKSLYLIAEKLEKDSDFIIEANRKDLETAEQSGLKKSLIDRLMLNKERINKMAEAIREIAELSDPVGEIIGIKRRPNGIEVGQMRVPLGVIGVIYEARPNVTSDITALGIKSGNGVVLRGGKEAIHTNKAIVKSIKGALAESSVPTGMLYFINQTDREYVKTMLKLKDLIDIIIPRGGESLINFVTENSLIPVVKHDKGVCNIYIEKDAKYNMAKNIIINVSPIIPLF